MNTLAAAFPLPVDRPRRLAAACALAAAALLAGCATLNSVQSDVTAFSAWPEARKSGTYAFERLPSQRQRPQQTQLLEDAARPALERAGFVPVPAGQEADVTVQIGARVTEYDRSPFDDPFWYGARGPFHRSFAYGRYGRPFWGPSWGWGPWGGPGAWDTPYYDREVVVLIRDRRSGEPLYETRAHSDGSWSDIGRLLPAMYAAAMSGFPKSMERGSVRIPLDGSLPPR